MDVKEYKNSILQGFVDMNRLLREYEKQRDFDKNEYGKGWVQGWKEAMNYMKNRFEG